MSITVYWIFPHLVVWVIHKVKVIQLKNVNIVFRFGVLAGELPPSLGKLTNMTKLKISDNAFSGNIADLTMIYLKYNQSIR